jgi:prephenate dehydrogenase
VRSCDTRTVRLAILGLGLIGGSVARALSRSPDAPAWSVSAWSPTGAGPGAAVRDGVVDEAASTPEAALRDADLVVLAAPPRICLGLLEDLAGPWARHVPTDVVVTDVASTKGAIVARADALGLRFVGGHPMAGLDASGYDASRPDLFADRPWVVVPGARADEAAIIAVETLAVACGARPLRLDPSAHDAAVAAISHLPLVLSAALVEAVVDGADGVSDDWAIARTLAAGGWRDMTRLARGDVTMGAQIASTNARQLADRVRTLRGVLDAWLAELERDGGPDEEAIARRLGAARDRITGAR